MDSTLGFALLQSSHRAGRTSIGGPQTDRCQLGDLATAKAMAWKPSGGDHFQEPGEVDEEAGSKAKPVGNSDPSRPLAIRSTSENEPHSCDVSISVVRCTSAEDKADHRSHLKERLISWSKMGGHFESLILGRL